MASGLRRLLPPTPELQKALWLGAVLFTITCSYTLVKVARDALFLSRLPAQKLPLVYVLVGVLTLVVTWAYGRATHRLSPLRTLAATALIAALVLMGFASGFRSGSGWLPVGFYVWVNIYGLILTSQFWSFTNSRSDPTEAKRIFGIIGGGGILGGLVGGLVAASFGHRLPLQWLALGAAALLIAMVVAIVAAVRQGHVPRLEEAVDGPDGPPPALARVPYVRWLALAALASVIVTGLVDYEFKLVAQSLHPDAPGLAAFFGRVFVALNLAALALQLLGTRWLLQRFGAGAAAGVLPAGLAVGATATILAPGFWSVVGTRLWDQILRFSLNKSTTELFYFPLEPGLRRRAKALIEAGIERFGDALAGLLIAGAGLFVVVGPVELSSIIAVLVVIWLLGWLRLSGGYGRELGRSLRRMNPAAEQELVSLRERGVLKELVRALDSPHERVVLQAIEMLAGNAAPLLDARVPRLLEHRSATVRVRALELAREQSRPETRNAAARLLRDPDPRVRLEALRAHCAIGPGGAGGALDEYLAADDPGLRATALQCLVEGAGPADVERVRRVLEPRLRDGDPRERAIAAEALGVPRAPAALQDLLIAVFDDPEPAVRRAALRSAGAARRADWIPALMRALAGRETEDAARAGLLAFGEDAVGPLADALADPGTPLEIRRVIPRVLGEIPAPRTVEALVRTPAGGDLQLDYRVLKAANEIRRANPALEFPRAWVEENLDRDVRGLLALEIHAASQREAAAGGDRFLLRVLEERREQALDRIFRHLALLYAPRAIFRAYHGLRSSNTRVRGSAEEYLATALSAEHRAWMLPLLPGAPPEVRAELARTRYGLVPLGADESLVALLEGADPWLRAVALYLAGAGRRRELLRQVESGLRSQDARVRETADWARLAILGAAA